MGGGGGVKQAIKQVSELEARQRDQEYFTQKQTPK
jgi:hypothetical protein